jgi:Zn-dependent peptidase ImmA (M78 family)/transcriptional regulator with XRE-family HTH domain
MTTKNPYDADFLAELEGDAVPFAAAPRFMRNRDKLTLVFGEGAGDTAEKRARESRRSFLRGLDQLAVFEPTATGRCLAAREALEAYGLETLHKAVSEGSVVLSSDAGAAGRVLRERREALGISREKVAKAAGITLQELDGCESSARLPLRTYEEVARELGLDERFVGVKDRAVGNENVAVRLRNVGAAGRVGPSTVAALAEAAWVGLTQSRLESLLGFGFDRHGLKPNPNYGTPRFPAFSWGYQLANEVRAKLGVDERPVESMRKVVEEIFHIPLIQTELGDGVAGATLENEGHRCIVVNLSGDNRSVTTRRATIAHELGHLLFDPVEALESLRVDTYEELERDREKLPDRVEQRANAFAVELLAPQSAILKHYEAAKDDPLFAAMVHFGIGRTAARFQIFNGADGRIPLQSIETPRQPEKLKAMSHWEGIESFTVNSDFHPLRGIRSSRQGRFCAVVLRSAEEGLISWDTAASHLDVTEEAAREALGAVREFFPSVWGDSG